MRAPCPPACAPGGRALPWMWPWTNEQSHLQGTGQRGLTAVPHHQLLKQTTSQTQKTRTRNLSRPYFFSEGPHIHLFSKGPCLFVLRFPPFLPPLLNLSLLHCSARTGRRRRAKPDRNSPHVSTQLPFLQASTSPSKPEKNQRRKRHIFHLVLPFIGQRPPSLSLGTFAGLFPTLGACRGRRQGRAGSSAAVPLASPLSPALCSHLLPPLPLSLPLGAWF